MAKAHRVIQETITGRTFQVGLANTSDLFKWDCILVDCNLVVHDPANVQLYRSRFIRCHFELRKPMARTEFAGCYFDGCCFSGIFRDCYFGRDLRALDFAMPLDQYKDTNTESRVVNCDFSNARMHACYFMNSDIPTIRFPTWPTITIIDPKNNLKDWLSIPFPLKFQKNQREAMSPGDVLDAETIDWEVIAARLEIDIDPTLVQELLRGKAYIRF